MGLLDTGNHVLEVYPSETQTDRWGNKVQVPSSTPVSVRGSVQPSTSNELPTQGQVAKTTIRFISRWFPGGPWARVHWDGRDWDVVGEPRTYSQTRRVGHTTTYLVARTEDNGSHHPQY